MSPDQPPPGTAAPPAPPRRLPRAQRRDQILAAATRAFAGAGYAATSLDDIADQAGVSRIILYRHFDSKRELYLAVLDRVVERLIAATSAPDFTAGSIDGLLAAAAQDPEGFRLVFHHAAREPEFREHTNKFRDTVIDVARAHLAAQVPDPRWGAWASSLVPTVVIEAVIAWLDAGQPDPATTASRLQRLVEAVMSAATS